MPLLSSLSLVPPFVICHCSLAITHCFPPLFFRCGSFYSQIRTLQLRCLVWLNLNLNLALGKQYLKA